MSEPYLWPDNVNNVAYNPWTDLRWRKDVAKLRLKFPWERIPEKYGKLIIQSYYAAVSYVDNMIGKLIHQLHVSRIRENTIVILTSDHGWALGEHAIWSKYSNFDVAVHVPLIISIPTVTFDTDDNYARSMHDERYNITHITNYDEMRDKTDSEHMIPDEREIGIWNSTKYNTRGYKRMILETYIRQRYKKSVESSTLHISKKLKRNYCRVTNAVVELVDIFPTIADLAGVPVPICQNVDENHRMRSKTISISRKEASDPCSEGITLLPLVESTLRCQNVSWKRAAFSQYPRPGIQPTLRPNSDKPRLKEITIMGYTLKTSDYRYTAWIPFAHETCKPDWDIIIAEELYDHRTDRAEDFNIATSLKMLNTKKYLRSLLKNGWRDALPRY